MGNRGKAAFASPNEIAPAIGGCLLAFDVRLVKCTGCDPPFEESMAPPITGSWTVRDLRILRWLATMHRRSRRSEQQACSIITLPLRVLHVLQPCIYLVITLTTYILLPVVLVQIGVV